MNEPIPIRGGEIAFIDSRIEDIQGLIDGLKGNMRVVLLDSNVNGINQISSVLSDYRKVNGIHFFTHGEKAEITLGSTTLKRKNIARFSEQLNDWGSFLHKKADLLFYGCNVARGAGWRLMDDIAAYTRADVAASDDLTGAASLGGDWDLEVSTGRINTDVGVTSDIRFEEVLQGKAIFNANFNKGSLKGFRLATKEKHGIVITDDPTGSNNKVVKFDLRKGDRLAQNKTRAELIPIPKTTIQFGKTYTYSFRHFLPNDWQADPSWEVLAQWHGVPDKGEKFRNSAANLFSSGGGYRLRHKWTGHRIANNQSQISEATSWSGNYIKGRWVQWKFVIKWSYKGDGAFKAYRDGKLIAARQGPNTFNDAVPPYMKIGVYKADFGKRPHRTKTSRRVYYVDDVQIFEGGSAAISGDEQIHGGGGGGRTVGGNSGGGNTGSKSRGNKSGGGRSRGGDRTGGGDRTDPIAPLPQRPVNTFSHLLPQIGGYRDVSLPSFSLLAS
ncbi:MAG: DUF4347 domain-containing protein [Synechococcus sp.]